MNTYILNIIITYIIIKIKRKPNIYSFLFSAQKWAVAIHLLPVEEGEFLLINC